MNRSQARFPFTRRLLALAGAAILAGAACAPQPAAPTAAPPKPAPTTAPAKTEAPAAKPAPTAAPAAKPAPTAAPAAKPTEVPAAKPEAKPAAFDEKAVADFYRGKTVRIVVGYGPGGATDVSARLLQQFLTRYLPGNPTVVVENKPGAGSMLAANTVYNTEAKDGTVIAAFSGDLVTQQALGAKGVQFDAARYNWLGSTYDTLGACAARVDSGITSIKDLMEGGKELTVASFGKGTASYDPPAVMNVALGTRFKIVTGYESGATQLLAAKNKEVQGWCGTFETLSRTSGDMFEGSNPVARMLLVTGDKTPDHPFLKGVPAAETLAKTQEGKALLQAVQVPFRIQLPHAVAPEVPKDRVEALRRARDKAYADPELRAAAEKAQLAIGPKTGEELSQIVQGMLSLPPATLDKLRTALE